MKKFDAVIIGAGQAGNPLVKRLSEEGKKVALVESEWVGGSCVNYGCTPTKTLVGIAKKVSQVRRAEKYGITVRNELPDYALVHQQKEKVVRNSREGLKDSLTEDPNITLFHGKGRFSGYKEIHIQSPDGRSHSITGNWIFINTGVQPQIPDIAGLSIVKYYTSKTILDLKSLPKHLLIIGGGYIALEFSQIFRRMGSRVTVIEKETRLLPKEDEDVEQMVTEILEKEGIQIITGGTTERVTSVEDESVEAEVLSKGKSFKITGTHLLVAVGTVPNTRELDLPKTGIQVDKNGFIPVNNHLETTEAGIYALGDVKGGPAFTHVSYNDYIVVTDHLFGDKAASIQDRLIPYCLFIDPELGRIGITEKEAREQNLDFSVAKLNTSSIARAIETEETTGFIKAVVDNTTKRVLGVSAICAIGGEFMSFLQLAMLGRLTYEQLRDTMFSHPTYAEAMNTLFSESNIKPGFDHDSSQG